MPDIFIRIVNFDPLLSNAEAEWFKDQFERIAAAYGFPIARRLPGVKPSALRTAAAHGFPITRDANQSRLPEMLPDSRSITAPTREAGQKSPRTTHPFCASSASSSASSAGVRGFGR